MELVQQVMANLEVDEGKAEKGVGAILTAFRMSADKDTFERIKQAVPAAERYMGRALMSGARTGEISVMVGPAGLMAALAAAGWQKDDVPRLGRIVIEYLRPTVGNAPIEQFLEKAPALK